MVVAFLAPVPPPERNDPRPKSRKTGDAGATLVILLVAAVLMLPFGWSHQTRSKWPLSDMHRVSDMVARSAR